VKPCASLQERLADEGVALMDRDAAIREHVAGCGECSAFVATLGQLDAGLSRLPPMTPPPSLVARTLEAVAGKPKPAAKHPAVDPGARQLAASLAAVVVLGAGFALTESVQTELDQMEQFVAQQFAATDNVEGDSLSDDAQPAMVLRAPASQEPRSVMSESPAEPEPLAQAAAPARRDIVAPMASFSAPASPQESTDAPLGEIAALEPAPRSFSISGLASTTPPSKERKKPAAKTAGKSKRESDADGFALGGSVAGAAPPQDLARSYRDEATRERGAFQEAQIAKLDLEERSRESNLPEFEQSKNATLEARGSIADEKSNLGRRQLSAALDNTGRAAGAKDALRQNVSVNPRSGLTQPPGPRQVARRFLSEQERLTGLSFQPDSGYWANTYVPGDPAIRLLEARLQRWDRTMLTASIGDARLENAARQNWQPFDLPENAALATYLHADKRTINGRSRLRIQVGLQASEKRSGLRPDMNVGVVLDLRRPLDDATGAKLRALVAALARARQPGDRFSITVAGHPGGLLVAPEAFRHGPISVAMQSLFTADRNVKAPSMDLLAALHSASQRVRQEDDASAPLGASLVLLVSTAPIAEQRESLERLAHENAVAGIGLSVVAVGGGTELAAIDRLVLLGQGHRRVLAAPEDAVKLVDRELHAASRAVARAVRLRIRLAPGVELIDVLGSKNLSEQAAQRVRAAERSIDQRVARNIGIRADRGDDEEGIQIVIPSFFAGDNHAVLLDVVVSGPGPVADVSVRYKDLVYRRNGVARVRLAIADGNRAPGALEHNVLKNQLAHELARAASTASRQLAGGDRRGAAHTLSVARDLFIGMSEEIPGWDNDQELRADVVLLAQYLAVLDPRFPGAGPYQQHLADSLRYLAFRRLIAPHE